LAFSFLFFGRNTVWLIDPPEQPVVIGSPFTGLLEDNVQVAALTTVAERVIVPSAVVTNSGEDVKLVILILALRSPRNHNAKLPASGPAVVVFGMAFESSNSSPPPTEGLMNTRYLVS
jgi:hypothetical protein